ncbi:hypothetical protein RYX36_002192 [Vicia faba]
MSSRVLKKLIAMLEAEEAEASKSENHGTSNAFNNHGGGDQNFSNAKINSGSNSGDRKKKITTNNHGERTVNNSGTFHGNGNGGYTEAFNNGIIPEDYLVAVVALHTLLTAVALMRTILDLLEVPYHTKLPHCSYYVSLLPSIL